MTASLSMTTTSLSSATPSTSVTYVTSEANPHPLETTSTSGGLCGRCCSQIHLPQCCGIGSIGAKACIAAVGVAGAILCKDTSSLATILLSGIGTVSGLFTFADIYTTLKLCAWEPKHSLEETVAETTASTETLRVQVIELGQQVTQLNRTKLDLETALSTERAATAELNRLIETHHQELDDIEQRMTGLQRSLDETVRLKNNWQKMAQAVSSEIVAFHGTVKDFLSQDVSSHISDIEQVARKTEMETEETRQILERISQARNGWATLIAELAQKLSILQSGIDQKAQQVQQLKDTLSALREENASLSGSVAKYQEMRRFLEQLSQEFERTRAAMFDELMPILRTLLTRDTSVDDIQSSARRAIEILDRLRSS